MAQLLSRRSVLLAAGGLVSACATSTRTTPGADPVVETTAGRIRGLNQEGVAVFKGVRYGAPPARFQRPEPPAPWAGVVDAFEYGSSAPQMAGGAGLPLLDIAPGPRHVIGDEDCLFLNVWTPGLDGARRPVMFWMHGGGYRTGSGSSLWYDGTRLARKNDVVVVTINHRLNVFGYCYFGELTTDERFADAGNVGMLDCVHALEWVRDNIERFGGDPDTVMIHGESGGGLKTTVMMAMESAEGLFHRAAVQSGSALTMTHTREAAAARTRALAQTLGLGDDVERLVTVPFTDLEAATDQVAGQVGGFGFAPVVDGRTFTRDPFEPDAPAMSAHVPMVIGTNRTEQSLFLGFEEGITELGEADLMGRLPALEALVRIPETRAAEVFSVYKNLYPNSGNDELLYMISTDARFFLGATMQAERKAAQAGAPAFFYQFYWETPVDGGRFFSPHAAEVPFVFNTLASAQSINGPVTEHSQALADQISTAFATFARTGIPVAPGLPAWPEYDVGRRATMIFDVESRVEDNPRGRQRELLASLPAVGYLRRD